MEGGRGDEIVGKKFPMPLSRAEVFDFSLLYLLPTRSKEKEKFSLSEDILIGNQYQCPNQ